VHAREWAHGNEHSARLLAERNAKLAKEKRDKEIEKARQEKVQREKAAAAEQAKTQQKASAKPSKPGRSDGAGSKEDMVRQLGLGLELGSSGLAQG
jgi:hypothetical protein